MLLTCSVIMWKLLLLQKRSHLIFTVVYVNSFLQLMKTMGLRNGVIWWSWFINTYLGMLLMTIVATIFRMVGRVLFVSNGLIVFLYLATFSLSTLVFWWVIESVWRYFFFLSLWILSAWWSIWTYGVNVGQNSSHRLKRWYYEWPKWCNHPTDRLILMEIVSSPKKAGNFLKMKRDNKTQYNVPVMVVVSRGIVFSDLFTFSL